MMKKILCIILTFCMLFAISGCKQNNDKLIPTEIVEPQYESKYFSRTALEQIASQYTGPTTEFKNAIDIMNKIDGYIIDTYELNSVIYFLTDKGVYNCDKSLLTSYKFDADIKDNMEFVFVTPDFFILKNNDNKLTLYTPDATTQTKFYNKEIDLNLKDKVIFTDQDKNNYFSYCMDVVEKIDDTGITVTKYGLKDKWTKNVQFVEIEKTTLKFSKELESNIKDYILHMDADSPEGYLLLENNNFYRITTEENFQDTKILNVKSEPISNVDKVFTTTYDYEVFLTKTDDKNTLYDVVYNQDLTTYEVTITDTLQYQLPDGYTTDDIEYTLCNCDIIKFKDGKYFEKNDTGYIENNTLTDILSKGDFKDCFEFNNHLSFVMDDRYFYTLLNDNIIANWNIK